MPRIPGLTLVFTLFASGCGLLGGLEVKSLGVSADKPGNVAVYLSVTDGDAPVGDLSEQNFSVYENGQRVDRERSGLTLLDRDVVADFRTVLLVDMSDAARRDELARAAMSFVENARRTQAVTVYAFDGDGRLHAAGDFARSAASGEGAAPTPLSGLASFATRDPSRDLHGAIVAALAALDARLMQAKQPVRVGTLVVFTEGPDLAGRVSADALEAALDETDHEVFALGLGEDASGFSLSRIGRAGVLRAPTAEALGPTFADAGSRVSASHDGHYLVAYCSPARAGMRALRVTVERTNREGTTTTGSVEGEFDATGFGAGCNPKTLPRFVVRANRPAETNQGSASGPAGRAAEPRANDASEPEGIVPPPNEPGYAPATP